jgi:hypothetical protein
MHVRTVSENIIMITKLVDPKGSLVDEFEKHRHFTELGAFDNSVDAVLFTSYMFDRF